MRRIRRDDGMMDGFPVVPFQCRMAIDRKKSNRLDEVGWVSGITSKAQVGFKMGFEPASRPCRG